MTDAPVPQPMPTPSERERWTWTVSLVVFGVLWSCSLIFYLTFWGKSENGMHYFSLTASWGLLFAVFVGMGVIKSVEASIIGKR